MELTSKILSNVNLFVPNAPAFSYHRSIETWSSYLCQLKGDVLLIRMKIKADLGPHLYFLLVQRAHSRHDNDIAALNLDCLRGGRRICIWIAWLVLEFQTIQSVTSWKVYSFESILGFYCPRGPFVAEVFAFRNYHSYHLHLWQVPLPHLFSLTLGLSLPQPSHCLHLPILLFLNLPSYLPKHSHQLLLCSEDQLF